MTLMNAPHSPTIVTCAQRAPTTRALFLALASQALMAAESGRMQDASTSAPSALNAHGLLARVWDGDYRGRLKRTQMLEISLSSTLQDPTA